MGRGDRSGRATSTRSSPSTTRRSPTSGFGQGSRKSCRRGTSTSDGPPRPPRHAALMEVVAWCREHAPADEPPTGLLWGDVRLGNVVFDETSATPRAILDWDMASAGPIEMDLAWHLALETVQTDLTGMVVPGFGTRDETIAHADRSTRPAAPGPPVVRGLRTDASVGHRHPHRGPAETRRPTPYVRGRPRPHTRGCAPSPRAVRELQTELQYASQPRRGIETYALLAWASGSDLPFELPMGLVADDDMIAVHDLGGEGEPFLWPCHRILWPHVRTVRWPLGTAPVSVNSSPGFVAQPAVIEQLRGLIIDLYGEEAAMCPRSGRRCHRTRTWLASDYRR